jgi:hypothetical protein
MYLDMKRRTAMPRKRHKPEEIVAKLRGAEDSGDDRAPHGGFRGNFVIFAQESRQFELPQMMRGQHLGRRRAGGRTRHALPGNESHIIGG